jgi:hypothetical protein
VPEAAPHNLVDAVRIWEIKAAHARFAKPLGKKFRLSLHCAAHNNFRQHSNGDARRRMQADQTRRASRIRRRTADKNANRIRLDFDAAGSAQASQPSWRLSAAARDE